MNSVKAIGVLGLFLVSGIANAATNKSCGESTSKLQAFVSEEQQDPRSVIQILRELSAGMQKQLDSAGQDKNFEGVVSWGVAVTEGAAAVLKMQETTLNRLVQNVADSCK